MRYKTSENVTLGALLPIGATVTIRVLNLDTDTLIGVSSNACVESLVIPGVFRWTTSNIVDIVTQYTTLYYEMTDGTVVVGGKFVYGGYIDAIGTPVEIADAVWDKDL